MLLLLLFLPCLQLSPSLPPWWAELAGRKLPCGPVLANSKGGTLFPRAVSSREKIRHNCSFGACNQENQDTEATAFVFLFISRLWVCLVLHREQGLETRVSGSCCFLPWILAGALGQSWQGAGAGPVLLTGDSRWQQEIQVPWLRVQHPGLRVLASTELETVKS